MAVLRLFASAREAAGVSVDRIEAQTVGDVLDEACRRYGEEFGAVLGHSRIWLNGQPTDRHTVLRDGDVVAVLPPVSGGAADVAAPAVPSSASGWRRWPASPPCRSPRRGWHGVSDPCRGWLSAAPRPCPWPPSADCRRSTSSSSSRSCS